MLIFVEAFKPISRSPRLRQLLNYDDMKNVIDGFISSLPVNFEIFTFSYSSFADSVIFYWIVLSLIILSFIIAYDPLGD